MHKSVHHFWTEADQKRGMQVYSALSNTVLMAHVLLCVLVISTVQLARCTTANGAPTRHTVTLHRGPITTTRDRAHQLRRTLSSSSSAEQHKQLYLSGLPAEQQVAVAATGQSCGLQILQALPPHHWLVSATPECIGHMMDVHKEVTAALLPPHFKLSSALDPLHPLSHAHKAGMRSTTGGKGAGASGPTTSQLPPVPDHLDTQVLPGGGVRIKLHVMGMPPSTDPRSSEPTRTSANTEASLLQDLLRSGLGYGSSSSSSSSSECTPVVVPIGDTGFHEVRVCLHDLNAAKQLLAEQPSIQWVDVVRRKVVHNLMAGSVLQSGAIKGVPPGYANNMFPNDPVLGDPRRNSSLRPFWAAGLDGTGQLVGVADTGIDMDSCYFWDPSFADFNTNTSNLYTDRESGAVYFHHPDHRKVPYYFQSPSGGDFSDARGHGTHTSGTVAGAAYGFDPVKQPDYATGLAPGARLAFFDMSNDSSGNVNIPSDPYDLFEVMYKKGVRVSSNSWSEPPSGLPSYSESPCALLDRYLWHRQDLLLLFSGSNRGAYQVDAYRQSGTVSAPALCKNVIAVGASESWVVPDERVDNLLTPDGQQVSLPPSWHLTITDLVGAVFTAYDSFTGRVVGNFTAPGSSFWEYASPFISLTTLAGRTLEVALSDPLDACAPLDSRVYRGKVVLASDSQLNCNFTDKSQNLLQSGAKLILFYSSNQAVPRYYNLLTGVGPDTATPASTLDHDTGTALLRLLSPATDVAAAVSVKMRVIPQRMPSPFNNVASFSPFGAYASTNARISQGQDVRIKPDIIAPGMTRSAKSSGDYEGKMDSCSTEWSQGTSMSTPAAAGAATLVRQYFMDGFYPTGAPVPGHAYQPSASLIRAVIVAGAETMTGIAVATGRRLVQPPKSPHQGYGRLHLGRSLPLANSSLGWNLTVVDRAVFNDTSVNHTYTVTATGQGPLIVVLSYVDWPGFPSSQRALVNDLNLVVRGPGGGSSNSSWGNNVQGGDRRNNVERVVLDTPAAGTYTITVAPAYLYILARPQYYSLVTLGAINGTIDSPNNPAHAGVHE